MEITEVEIFPFDTKEMGGNTIAIADVTFDNVIKIKSFKIIESKSGGLFVTYPSQRGKDGSFYDIVIVKDKELQKEIRNRIVEEYKKS
ncbi:SpoVG family protein [bacterium]|nr:SpoVG family protein [bacterium]